MCLSVMTLLLLLRASMRGCGADSNGLLGFPRMRWSGKCTDVEGGRWITDLATCEQARTAFGLRDTNVGLRFNTINRVQGCYSNRYGSEVVFNQWTTSTDAEAFCGDYSYACLCAPTRAPACDPQDGSNPHASSPLCVCGTGKLCSSNTGMVCDATSNTCSQTPTPCADTSGATKQETVCKCGGVDCTSGTGFFCNAQSSLCRPYAVPTCTGIYGTVEVPADMPKCACAQGTECSAGEYCFASIKQCSTNGMNFIGFPPIRRSGKCTDMEGGRWITDLATCFAAFSRESAALTYSSLYASARGCLLSSWGGFYFNPEMSSYIECTDTWSCMCSAAAPACDPRDGSDPHTSSPSCVCGTGKLCSSDTGMVCNATSNTCSQTTTSCADTSGATKQETVCKCGGVDCTSGTGFFCNAAISHCSQHAVLACSPLDGSNPHTSSPLCVCGMEKLCSSNTGMVCNATSNTCSQTPTPCAHISGTDKPRRGEEVVCKCGNIDCTSETGFYCYAALSQCSVDGKDFAVFPHKRRWSGKCTDEAGGGWIPNENACQRANLALGLSDKSVSRLQSTYYPRGCYSGRDGAVSFNPNTDSSQNCGTSSPCLCTATAPACDPQDGSKPHTFSSICVCGPEARLCYSNAGMVCNGTSSRCSHAPACPHVTGMIENPGVCGCNTTDCTSATGFFCNAKISLCGERGKVFVLFPKMLKSGGCTDNDDFDWIVDIKMCERAGIALGLKGTSVSYATSSKYPRGCISSSDGTDLVLNNITSSNVECGNTKYGDKYQYLCLCASPVTVACAPANGSAPHNATPSCICGSDTSIDGKICNSISGMVCNSSSRTCSHAEPCPDRLGTSANPTTCSCVGVNSTIDCIPKASGGSGLFCHYMGSSNESPKCADDANPKWISDPCKFTDGVTPNTVPCVCESGEVCTKNTKGLVCSGNSTHLGTCHCAPGQYRSSGLCKSCSPGKYSDIVNVFECSECESGRYDLSHGAVTCEHNCSAGRYSEKSGRNSDCNAYCPPGRFSNQTGLSNKDQCLGLCSAGKFSEEKGLTQDAQCTLCSKGRFSSNIGLSKTCGGECPRGTFSNRSGITSANDCYNCSAGRYSSETGLKHDSECSECVAGKFSPRNGQIDESSACNVCPEGYFAPESSSSACMACQNGFFIEDNGVLEENHKTCNKCPPSQPVSGIAATFCYSCVVGEYNTSNTSMPCRICPKGWHGLDLNEAGNVCEPCGPGFYQPSEAKSFCLPCIPGKYQDTPGQTSCEKCKPGSFVTDVNATICKPVDPGYEDPGSRIVQIPCPRGRYGKNATSGCINCPTGWFSNDTGLTTCYWCQPGQSADTEGRSSCDLCEIGKFGVARMQSTVGAPVSLCQSCPVGRFQDTKGQILCRICEKGKIVNDKLTACDNPKWITADKCSQLQYLDDRKDVKGEWSCEPCPPGGSCFGDISWSSDISRGNFPVLFGWARCPRRVNMTSNTTTTISYIEACPFGAACLGMRNDALMGKFKGDTDPALLNHNESCNKAYRNNSFLCSACAPKFSHSPGDLSGKCDKCPNPGANIFVAIIGMIMAVFAIFVYIRVTLNDGGKAGFADASKSILLSFVQILSLLTTFPVPWARILTTVFQIGSAVTVLGQHMVNLKCMLPHYTEADVFYASLLTWAVLPLLLSLTCAMVWVCIELVFGQGDIHSHAFIDKVRTSVVALMYLIWAGLCSQIFQLFACRKLCGESRLSVDIEELCFAGRHLSYVVGLGLPMLLVYVIGFPAGALLAVSRLHRRAELYCRNVEDCRGHKTWSLMYSSFRKETWWWEGTVAARKIAVASIGVFGVTLGHMQVHLTLVMVFLIILLTALIKPYDNILLQRIEIASLSALFGTLWVASIFTTYPYCEENGHSLAWCEFLAVLVGLTDVGVVIVIVVLFFRAKDSAGCIKSFGRRVNYMVDRMHGREAVAARQQIRIRRKISNTKDRTVEMFENPALAARSIELATYIGEVRKEG